MRIRTCVGFYVLLFLLVLPFAFSQKVCGDVCSYQDKCDPKSECPACMDVNRELVGPGPLGNCQPAYQAPEMSDVVFYGIVAVGIFSVFYFMVRLKNKRAKNI